MASRRRAPRESAWRSLENEPIDTWRRTIVDHAPASVRRSAHGFVIRAVFGLPLLREKLLCLDHDIDDRLLEALKFELMRSGALPMHQRARPLLLAIDDQALEFECQVFGDGALDSEEAALGLSAADPEWTATGVMVPRARLSELYQARADWRDFWREMSAGPYVDTGRLLVAGTDTRPE